MNVPSPREPSHGDSRWATIRYALTSNARTARLCLILLVMTGVPGVLLAVVLPHIRLRRAGPMLRVLTPIHGGIRCRHFAGPARPPARASAIHGTISQARWPGGERRGRLAPCPLWSCQVSRPLPVATGSMRSDKTGRGPPEA